MGRPWANLYIEVHRSKKDVTGNAVLGDRVATGRTDNAGLARFELAPGDYTVTADLPGYNWGTLRDHDGVEGVIVTNGRLTALEVKTGTLTFSMANVDRGIGDHYVEVYTQRPDVSGNPVLGGRVCTARTDNAGRVICHLTPGVYIVVSDLPGASWGDLRESEGQTGVAIVKGANTGVSVRLGRIRIAAGKDEYAEVYLQQVGADGKTATAARVGQGRTDNAGFLAFDLTEGSYAVRIRDRNIFDVAVEGGKTSDVTP